VGTGLPTVGTLTVSIHKNKDEMVVAHPTFTKFEIDDCLKKNTSSAHFSI
jgi:hypothetical protein